MARYIDADALIKNAENKRLVFDTAKISVAEALRIQGKAIREAIENAPTADVAQVKHGMWLHKNGEMICSVCGGEALMDEVYYKSPFCPDCGAKMDGRSDGDDL